MIRTLAAILLFSGACFGSEPSFMTGPLTPVEVPLAPGTEVLLAAEAPSVRLRWSIETGEHSRSFSQRDEVDLQLESYDGGVLAVRIGDCAEQLLVPPIELYADQRANNPLRTLHLPELCDDQHPCVPEVCADLTLIEGTETLVSGTLRIYATDVSAQVFIEDVPTESGQ